jgi:hypothetical protein
MRFLWLPVALVVCAAGCSGSRFVPVSGRITLNGKALVNAKVVFQPVAEEKNPGPGSQGTTDKDGRFTLASMTGEHQGALVGKHKVSIVAYEGDDTTPSSGSDMAFRKRIVPDEFNVNSKLTFDVPAGGTSEANFDLVPSSKPR